MYLREPLQTYLDDIASGKPAPGGGSVSACAGALGAALVAMAGNLTAGREKFAAVDAQARQFVARADEVRTHLEQLLQDDTEAYNGVIAAYRLPKESEGEKAARHQAVQNGLILAADVPTQICRTAVQVCRLSRTAAEIGNPAAVTDAAIGAVLGEAAVVGAALNVRINLASIEDHEYVQRAQAELDLLLAEAAGLRADVLRLTNEKL